ncbi:uracil-DNA glycosylase [Actinopolymorpha alba]|uniref:uracil-DNA glycosylase n=1 Tax=Actinopolymorpha alba TaxID=533267 RepID=UPI000366D458|nr:uracil-DNA glycosylase [Actinopolymorpha alba]
MTVKPALPHPVTGAAYPSPVPPGTHWPDDPATARTPVAEQAEDVVSLAVSASDLHQLTARQSVCRACPRLVAWREQVAGERRRAFADQPYWGRPVPGWGSDAPKVLIVGLAPAAHGGNRTGRIFTGDRSGDWLFAALHEVGLAATPTSTSAGDGQGLPQARVVAAVRCAPPDNKPLPSERDACFPWLVREVELCRPSVRSVVALGMYGWNAALRAFAEAGYSVPRPRPKFGHGAETVLAPRTAGPPEHPGQEVLLVGSYHPSQQNTFTGKLTHGMLEAVLDRAKTYAGLE